MPERQQIRVRVDGKICALTVKHCSGTDIIMCMNFPQNSQVSQMDQLECDESRTTKTTGDMFAGIAAPLFIKNISLAKTMMLSTIKQSILEFKHVPRLDV